MSLTKGLLLILLFLFNRQHTADASDNVIADRLVAKLKAIDAKLDPSKCLIQFNNQALQPKCHFLRNTDDTNCPNGPPGPRLAWLHRCFANMLVEESKFQVPVQVINGPSEARKTRISRELAAAGFKYVTIRHEYVGTKGFKSNSGK